jgi:hypothetical protein
VKVSQFFLSPSLSLEIDLIEKNFVLTAGKTWIEK